MDKSLEVIHRRNQLMIILLVVFNLFILIANLNVQGVSNFFPALGLVFCAVFGLLIYEKKSIILTMHSMVWMMFAFFSFLINIHPNLVNFLFMWLGLVLSSLYQNTRVIILAGLFSMVLTVYSFFTFHKEIFPGVMTSDIVYLVFFTVFVTVFLLFSSLFTSRLWVQAQQNENKIKSILENGNMMTFSYNVKTGKRTVTSDMKMNILFEKNCPIGHPLICDKSIHPDDIEKIRAAEKEIFQGVEKKIEYRATDLDGCEIWLKLHLLPIIDQNFRLTSIEGILEDITEEKNYESKIQYLAYHDHLTGLPNRMRLNDYFEKVISTLDEVGNKLFVVYIDLDSFKEINDTYGHEMGDRLIVITSVRILSSIRDTDMLSRVGGDEFVGILTGVAMEEVQTIASRIKNNLSAPISIDDYQISVTPSIGISVYENEKDGDLDKLIKKADTAMYRAKQAGKNEIQFY
jgi:diguanylate cyclase (GGDEF)-like protein